VVFFPNGIAYEPSCEPSKCNADMLSFKGFLHRWMGSTAQLAPFTYDTIMPVIKTSIAAAVAQCTGGTNGRFCGFHWSTGQFDGTVGAGQQMNVLGGLSALLASSPPLTNTTGGTSVGDANAGSDNTDIKVFSDITGGDRAGAGILTAVILAGCVSALAWMNLD
jgi:mannan endo-1,6-alpha-mannosidase